MSKIKTLIQLEMDILTAYELADRYYKEAKALEQERKDLFNIAREECGKSGQTIYEYLGVEL